MGKIRFLTQKILKIGIYYQFWTKKMPNRQLSLSSVMFECIPLSEKNWGGNLAPNNSIQNQPDGNQKHPKSPF